MLFSALTRSDAFGPAVGRLFLRLLPLACQHVSMVEPKSPDHKAYIDNYTPSKEPQDVQDFFGRRRLRIMNG